MGNYLTKRIKSFGYAFKGIQTLFGTQPNAQIHGIVGVLVVAAGFWFQISTTEWLIVVLVMAVVLATEAVNTALEFLTDLVSPDYHELAGKSKDVAAAAVLIIAIGAVIIGCIIFIPKVSNFINN